MSREEKEKRDLIFNKIAELANMASIQGLVTEDVESILVAESIKVVLTASQDENHLELLHTHMSNFLEEVQVLMGKKSVKEFLLAKERCEN
jgi:hypothetical protein